MAYGAGNGDQPTPPGEMLASEAERERCQTVLKQAALNTHPGRAAGLRDAVKRMASIDPGS